MNTNINANGPLMARSSEGLSLERKSLLDFAKKTLSKSEFEKFKDYYYSHFFFSRDELTQNHALNTPVDVAPTMFNKNGQNPFDGYLTARDYIFKRDSEKMGIQDAVEINRRLLSRHSIRWKNRRKPWEILSKPAPTNSEGALDAELGVIRGERVFDHGNSPSGSLDPATSDFLLETHEYTDAAFANNPLISKVTLERGETAVEYTPLSKWRFYANDLTPSTRNRLERLEEESNFLDSQKKEMIELRREVIKELLQSAYQKVHDALAVAKSKNERIDAIADFYRRFLTIHPFNNGNGRTARVQVERLLESVGLPPPVWTTLGQDVALTPESMRKVLRESVNLSQQLHNDLQTVMANGLDYHLTPTVFLLPQDLAKASPQFREVVPEDFMIWLKHEQTKPEPPANLSDAIQRYLKWKKTLSYLETENIDPGVRPATPTFLRTFGKLSTTSEDYQMKMANFYDESTIYRGIPLLEAPSDEEIVAHFARLKDSTTGMGVAVNLQDAKARIDAFNKDLFENLPALKRRIKAHIVGNGFEYGMSGFSSFSVNGTVALNFAKGVLASEQVKKDMKASLVVGMRRPKLASVDNRYPTQALANQGFKFEDEILITGASDPEAITSVLVQSGSGESGASRWRLAERISFDTVRLKATLPNGQQLVSYWKLHSDGTVTKVPKPNP